jgi:hypothetical protein
MPPTPGRPVCQACGEPIGVYEPLWHVGLRTGAQSTAWLQLQLDEGVRGQLWHAACAEADGIDGG